MLSTNTAMDVQLNKFISIQPWEHVIILLDMQLCR